MYRSLTRAAYGWGTNAALGAATFVLVSASPAHADVPGYDAFELQARSNIVDGFNLPANSSFNSRSPALNATGTIAFSVLTVGGGEGGLFVGAGGAGSVVYTALPGRIVDDPSINASGLVVFDQADLFSDGIFVYDPGTGDTTLTIAATFNSAGGTEINDAGLIGYRAGTFDGQTWEVWNGAATTYADETRAIAFLFQSDFDAAGHIGGKVRLGSLSGSAPDEIRVYDAPGSFTTFAQDDDADAGSPYVGFDNSIDLADDGSVAFIASLAGGARGVYLTDGVTTKTIATTLDTDVSEVSFFHPATNGTLVAFRGKDGAGLYAIFVGDGTELTRVVGEHDLIATDLGTARIDQNDGSVTFGGNVAMNTRGDLAFAATLTPPDNDQIEWGTGMFIAYAAVAGDVDDDGDVDFEDLVSVLASWGPCPRGSCPADVDGDGVVGFTDVVLVLANWSS